MKDADGKELERDLRVIIRSLGATRMDNDNQVLVAIRAANAALDRMKTTWEDLLTNRVKITIVADPFSGLREPPIADHTPTPSAPRTGAPRHTSNPAYGQSAYAPWRPTPQPQPQPRSHLKPKATPSGATQSTGKSNKFPGVCTKCGTRVAANAGILGHKTTSGTWTVECAPGKCVTSRRQRQRIDLDDLVNLGS